MKDRYELIVVGAGPAGLASAEVAARAGVDALLLDEQSGLGGQIYRNVDAPIAGAANLLGDDYLAGRRLTAAVSRLIANGLLDYQSDASVWNLEPGCQLSLDVDDRSREVAADRVLICAGAQERPMPIPGWELPGVMTAGAAQILLKTGGLVPRDNVVLAGSGPLLGLLCSQYIRAGARISAVIDTTPPGNRWRSLRSFPAALLAAEYLFKGVGFWWRIRRAGIPVFRNITALVAEGGKRLERVRFTSGGRERWFDTSKLLLHHGVIPQVQLAEVAGCDLRWDQRQRCWQVSADEDGATTQPGIYVAGDGAAIGGAEVAALRGRRIASRLLGIGPDRSFSLGRLLAIRPFLDTLFDPGPPTRFIDDDTLICRCEEVTAGQIRAIAARGCQGPNQAKSFSRAGMGPCQGRQCSLSVAALIADSRAMDIAAIEPLRSRPPVRPVTLEQMGGPQ